MKRIFHILNTQRLREYIMNQHKKHKYKDKNFVGKTAPSYLPKQIEQEKLRVSADLYAKIYLEDKELRKLTESASSEWPE